MNSQWFCLSSILNKLGFWQPMFPTNCTCWKIFNISMNLIRERNQYSIWNGKGYLEPRQWSLLPESGFLNFHIWVRVSQSVVVVYIFTALSSTIHVHKVMSLAKSQLLLSCKLQRLGWGLDIRPILQKKLKWRIWLWSNLVGSAAGHVAVWALDRWSC